MVHKESIAILHYYYETYNNLLNKALKLQGARRNLIVQYMLASVLHLGTNNLSWGGGGASSMVDR